MSAALTVLLCAVVPVAPELPKIERIEENGRTVAVVMHDVPWVQTEQILPDDPSASSGKQAEAVFAQLKSILRPESGIEFEVIDADPRRVKKVRILRPDPTEAAAAPAAK